MSDNLTRFQHIAVAPHPQIPEAVEESGLVVSFLQEQGFQVTSGMLYDESLRESLIEGVFDLLIALGGDGTMLRAGQLCGPYEVPILGINMGRFGFLMEIRQNQWRDAVLNLVRDNFWLEKRMMLSAEQTRLGQVLGEWEIVNEAVVSRGNIVRPVQMDASVDNRFLATYVADGLIASTPTGSTAYAMAAGGPILPPELRTILLVPIAPHLSIDRAIVLAEGSSVSIVVHTSHQAVLSIDGLPPVELADGDCVNVHASVHTLKFIRFQDPGYFYRNLTPHMSQNPSHRKSSMTSEASPLYCVNHPDVETGLRCNRCENPICVKCAVLTPTGYRCTDCVRSQQKIFNTAVWLDYLLAIPIALILAYIGSSLASRIGFFTIFIAPVAGMVIAEAIRFAIKKRRSKRLFQLSAGATAIGSLIPLLLSLLSGFFGLFMIWQIAFTLIVTSTVYYRLAGIRL